MNPYGAPYGRGRKCNALSTTDAAYIAALIDAEGTIGLTYRRGNEKRAERMTLHIAVTMTTPIILDWVIATTGLGVRNKAGYDIGGNSAHRFSWAAHAAGAYSLAEQIFPYLKLKDANACALIRIHQMILRDPMLRLNSKFIAETKQHFHDLNYKGSGNWGIKEDARGVESIASCIYGTGFSCDPWGEKLKAIAVREGL